MAKSKTTYNLRYADNGEWYRGYRTSRITNAKEQAQLVASVTKRIVAVYGGEGPYRVEFWRTDAAQ